MSAYPNFPDLSRKPALKTKGSTVDPTLRDDMDNGMETTRARFRRRRREFEVTIEFLSFEDYDTLDYFIEKTACYGANIFLFTDERNPRNPKVYNVRFSQLPKFDDAGWVEDGYRQTTTFTLREV